MSQSRPMLSDANYQSAQQIAQDFHKDLKHVPFSPLWEQIRAENSVWADIEFLDQSFVATNEGGERG